MTGPAETVLRFFLFETTKVLLLLVVVSFVLGVVRTYVTPAATRRWLAGRRASAAIPLAALLGVVTPFCSCSAVPLFIGFVTAGVPLGATFAFLVSAPMVNEVALVLLVGLFGWTVAGLYLVTGLSIAMAAGWVLGRARLEGWVEPWVYRVGAGAGSPEPDPGWSDRLARGAASTREITGRTWPFITAGVAAGAAVHGWVPADRLAPLLGPGAWWGVPVAVLIGVPLYANAAGMIPVVQALLAKGAALGTALAFMMAVVGLSFPEWVILRRVLTVRLIAVFAGTVAAGIVLVGYLFNAVL